MVKWSELPPEILHLISLKIDNPFDLIHFRSVCSFWRSSSLLKFRHMTSLRCPLPLDPGGCGDDCHILSSRVYLLKCPNRDRPQYWMFKLQAKENGEVVLHSLFLRRNSSAYGCLYPSLSIDLLNCQIFELAQEHVACYSEWFELFECISKCEERIGFMGLNREKNEYMILGKLSFNGLAMYRSVDNRWTELEITPDSFFEGIVPFKGKFYAIDRTGKTTVVDPTLEVNTFQRSRPCDKTRKRWLLMTGDKLILVEMCTKSRYDFHIPNIREKKIWFEISELNEERNDWDQVEDMDGRVLFLEHYCTFSCLATEIPGFRANSIIFMDLWGGSNSYELESILVYEFNEKGVRSLRDKLEYIELFPFPPGWVISNG
ncbi:putative F-box/kelch-repeat protein [Arabidopsis thaliana]|uniref:Putative F-box/kelch-repeat protein At5g24040 n=6 Tax=Arabidopsis TaxID=3701 RepID=FK112_ARATH|nr:F-box SKIP23-like protein (DUF295) [Arabidopsis thaliana]Q9FLV8.1 RecName: Full=Putative F-box/kelch-repeat protein At5g24040 [Arabidopsis thaliana]KAG7603274.1 hypothetical protein ISN45_At05g022550 [Arabidopsis thaliana x Arabidopsis arenosa]AED93248.1 F-box SKIP23-like protein (DUF295) [Arabidopsis thaliana]OAO93766.1 hypothetical protein AXX17_AT5G23690 [Arabidopsis thaliana]BAB08727.1 unnamed protein product [Arabidopsis thaliana]|eukprot:NP_197792.1 F-box SKIP23-like protein (DUF295) [Arabidopsis thaliana]